VTAGGRTIDAALDLLDRQIVDRDGRLSGKVDDLELSAPEDGDGGAPTVTAILAGPGALAHRLGGRLGRWVESVHARLHPSSAPEPARIPIGVVKGVGSTVQLSVAKGDLELSRFEDWVRERFVGRIPGAGRAPE
jgi:sporulation protein YlmC with PRC-barrel domain